MTNPRQNNRKKWAVRILCLIVAAALLASIVGTLIYTAAMT